MKRMRRLLTTGVAVFVVSCGGVGEDPSSVSSTQSSSSQSVSSVPSFGNESAGREIYLQQCVVCHGEAGEGVSQLRSPALVECSVCDNPTRLRDYIDVAMPTGGANAAQRCSGSCADDVTAYILAEFNSGPALACEDESQSPSPTLFKRLSRQEYQFTIMDLFQLAELPDVSVIPEDPSVHNFKTVASVQAVQASHLDGYMSIAGQQAEALLNDASRRDRVLGCSYTSSSCLSGFIDRFGRLAYRRPLTADESNRLRQYVQSNGGGLQEQYILAIQLLLSSPNFIYRVEVGNSPEGLSTLTQYELVARLAFALWGRGPDDPLLDQAAAGMLNSAYGLRRVASEMLQDVRARENMRVFFEQWLATNLLNTPVEEPLNWYDGILQDMRVETNSLLAEYVWQDKDFTGVFTESRTYLTSRLADYYGVARPESANQPVSLSANGPRAGTGILTHASNLFAKTDGDLVAIRGNWLRSTFLCKELKLPDGVADIINGKFAGLTPLEIIHERNRDESCERCHAQIDPIGIAFAQYNRQGLYDPFVNLADYPIEPGFPDSGDNSIESVKEIAEALSSMPEVGQCLAERLFLYTRAHEPEDNDLCSTQNAQRAFQQSGNQFTSLLLSLVEDPRFRVRAVPEPREETDEEETLDNVAAGKYVTTSSAQDGKPGTLMTDGDLLGESRWSAEFFPQQATIDLGDRYQIVQTEFYPYEDRAYQYVIEVSEDGNRYTQVVDRRQNTEMGNVLGDLFAPITARYVRISVSGVVGYTGDWISVRELKVLGRPL